MDGGAATVAIEVLLQNLINVTKEEISLIRGLEKNADKLGEKLNMIQSFMDDAQTKFITEDSFKTWLQQLEAASYHADNVLDELSYHLLSKKLKPSCFPSINNCARRHQMAHRVKGISIRFDSIGRDATQFGLQDRRVVGDAPAVTDAVSEETDSLSVDPIFIGRDDDVRKIVDKITAGDEADKVFSILPIVGMGGLGKTTLTRKVFNHEKTKTHFGEHIWVHVSINFDPVTLLKKTLAALTSENGEAEDREVVLKKLLEALREKTYLLVLDDVWNEDVQKWESFINSLSGVSSMKGNGIIVTTRSAAVASIVRTLPVYELQGLPDDKCWSIIKEKAFEGGDVPPGYETIGVDIAKRCQGLPLTANVIGSVLRGKSEENWRSIKEDWLLNEEEHEKNITKILKLSYDKLSSPSLKKCFAYCSVFPKGKKIDKVELIEVWMAEGFLQPDQTSDMESVGNRFLNLLLQNSLLQAVERDDYGNISHCIMHDLVHDLAFSVLRHKYYGHESSAVTEERAKCLRTLFYEGRFSDIKFSNFKSLHVLTLSSIDLMELPGSIKVLIHLRYLNITFSCEIPDTIGQLCHLQTFRALPPEPKAIRLYGKKLPATFKYLINLRHLHVDYSIELPAEVGKLTSLQTLPHFKVRKEKGHRIEELGSLTNLKGKLKIHNLEKVAGKEEAKNACLFMKPNLVKLVLKWDESREGEIKINDENVLEGLQPNPNLKMLKIFGFKDARFPSWTLKMAVRDEAKSLCVGLNNLVEIKLSSCSECEEIPMMGHLPHLKALFLSDMTNLKSIGASFYGIDSLCSSSSGVGGTIIAFPALKRIVLSNMQNLTEWVQVEVPSAREQLEVKVFSCLEYLKIKKCTKLVSAPSQEFPRLKELDIEDCDKLVCLPNLSFRNKQNLSELYIKKCPELRELPDGLHALSSLKTLTIEECPSLEELDTGLLLTDTCGIKLASLTEIKIENLEGLVCLPNWLFSNSPSLRRLRISSCKKLRELPEGLQTLTSLEQLTITYCPNLNPIAYDSSSGQGGLTSLRYLEIGDCGKLMDLPYEIVESCAPSLKELELRNLERLMNLPMIIDCLDKMQSLRSLTIDGVPKLIMTNSCSTLRNIEYLTLGPAASDLWHSLKSGVDGILQAASQSSSLRQVNLRGKEDWESLPDQIQHLTALKRLELHDFGIEELPEWFGHLTSLQELWLYNCNKLSSVKAMRRLTNLRKLDIKDCPVLKERCGINNNQHHSQWPNISHIPHIMVDWMFIRLNGLTTERFRYLDGA